MFEHDKMAERNVMVATVTTTVTFMLDTDRKRDVHARANLSCTTLWYNPDVMTVNCNLKNKTGVFFFISILFHCIQFRY
jgi:hypothetical protein